MLKTLRRILTAILITIFLFVGISYLLPSEVNLQESMVINSDTYLVYYQINNLKNWNDWCPLLQGNKRISLHFNNITEGKNANCVWKCNTSKTSDSGRLMITGNIKNSEIKLLADFFSFGNCNLIFSLKPTNDSIKVVLSLNTVIGNNPLSRWLALFSGKMLRPDLTAMLKGLKIRTEQIMQSSLYPIQIIQLPERQILSISDTTTPQRANRELYKMFSLIAQCINNQLLSKNGFPAASFNALNDTGLISISVQIPVKACIQNCPGIQCTKLPAQEALILTYTGNRNSISTAYHSIYKALSDRGLYNKLPIWEEYTEPASTLPSSVQSTIKLCYLIKNE